MQVTISGLASNDTAKILGSFPVCNSTVYLVDTVLVPAATLDAIPQINSSTVAAAAPAATPLGAPVAAPVVAPAKTGRGSPPSL
jgi:hypothetical protein